MATLYLLRLSNMLRGSKVKENWWLWSCSWDSIYARQKRSSYFWLCIVAPEWIVKGQIIEPFSNRRPSPVPHLLVSNFASNILSTAIVIKINGISWQRLFAQWSLNSIGWSLLMTVCVCMWYAETILLNNRAGNSWTLVLLQFKFCIHLAKTVNYCEMGGESVKANAFFASNSFRTEARCESNKLPYLSYRFACRTPLCLQSHLKRYLVA